jgi:DNA-binding MarR family transcriptional regulator
MFPANPFSIKSKIDSMDTQEIRTLKILEAIDCQDAPSQRDMAESLNISLGLINSFVRRLAKKGYFKITHLPRNRVRYILTPKGMAEKTRLSYSYVQLSYRFYRDARQKIRDLYQQLQMSNIKQIAFFGAGDLAEIAYLSMQETDLEFVAISDFDSNGGKFFGHRVVSLGGLKKMQFDVVILTKDHPEANDKKILVERGIVSSKIKSF